MDPRTLFFLSIGILLIAIVLFVGSLPAMAWYDINQVRHQPTMGITRDNDTIILLWYGGWNVQFIDHLRITVNGQSDYIPVPKPGQTIRVPDCPENITVSVDGWAVDCQYYRNIANTTV